MQAVKYFLLLSAIAASAVVSDADYLLTYRRSRDNELFLFCSVWGNNSGQENISFWINETEKIDIVKRVYPQNAAVYAAPNLVSFILRPQYEGTFYCGEINGNRSNGAGPMAAIQRGKKTSYCSPGGDNTTLKCPVSPGALVQAYNITWSKEGGLTRPYMVKNNISGSFLTIKDKIRREEEYICSVVTTNPIDGQIWRQSLKVIVQPPPNTWRSILIRFAIELSGGAVGLILVCICWCCCPLCCEKCSAKKCRREKVFRTELGVSDGQDKYSDLAINKNANIGNGAFGAVFRAIYKGSPCAAKLLTHHAQQMATGGVFISTRKLQTAALEAFRKECKYLKSLVHENIVRHFATVTEPNSDLPILVMELMDCSLKQYLEGKCNERLSILCQINLCSDIAKGLEFLHVHNVIHRDLCDDNVLLKVTGATPTAKIADFGMSRILPYDYLSNTLTGLGHRQVYLPPEAMDDPYHYTHTLDVYSFGVLATQIIRVKVNIRKKEDLRTIFTEIPETHALKTIIRSCLSEDKKNRPQAADVVKMIG